ncbi:MAG: bifunctional DNA-formamidopyrimidine glycosylase/DNA-(apurinic or apyrimidinic site) lyase [Myxococcota bacterium]
MPELPEVETVRRTVLPHVEGQRITRVWRSTLPLRRQKPDPALLRRALQDSRVITVERSGKYLLLRTDRGGALIHLGMSGQVTVEEADVPRRVHTHFVAALESGRELRLVDPRRFGLLRPFVGEAPPAEWNELGPDPLTKAFSVQRLAEGLSHTRRAIKLALLDQAVVAGLGNIYVAEALFLAGVHPEREAHTLRPTEIRALHKAIEKVLAQGIANRGTSLSDYVDALGEQGANQHHLLVYGRAGKPCVQCGSAVKLTVLGARSSFFCARCQPRRPRARR